MIIPAQIRHGRWVVLTNGRKCYIDDVDNTGENSGIGHFAVRVVNKPGEAGGEWIGTERIQQVIGNDPQIKVQKKPVDLGVATWGANKAGSIAESTIFKTGDRVIGPTKVQGTVTVGNNTSGGLGKVRVLWDWYKEKYKDQPNLWKSLTIAYKPEKLEKIQSETIKIDVNKGDEILTGKWKNHREVVKNIGKDDYDMPTINGKKAATFRMKKDNEVAGGLAKEKGLTQTDVDPKEFKMGIEVEKEHTDDMKRIKQTVLDHLTEDPKYYTKLKGAGLEEIFHVDANWGKKRCVNCHKNIDRGKEEYDDHGQTFCSYKCLQDFKDENPELYEGDPPLHHAKAVPSTPSSKASKTTEVFAGIDEPPKLAELADDAAILARIREIKAKIKKIQSSPSAHAYKDEIEIIKLWSEMGKLEKQLFSGVGMEEMKSLTEMLNELEFRLGKSSAWAWDKQTRTFSVEASDLGTNKLPRFFSLKNPDTGNAVKFTFQQKKLDNEGDVIFFLYISADGKYSAKIFND